MAAVPVAALALATPMLDEDGVDDDDDDDVVVKGGKLEEGTVVGSLCGKGRRRYGGSDAVAASAAAERREDDGGGKMWSNRVRSDAAGPPTPTPTPAAPKGGDGMPVNSCTMARKLEVSVVSTVVGARRDARVRFLDPLGGCCAAGAGAPPIAAPCPCAAATVVSAACCWRAPAPESGCATRGDKEEAPGNEADDQVPACGCCGGGADVNSWRPK